MPFSVAIPTLTRTGSGIPAVSTPLTEIPTHSLLRPTWPIVPLTSGIATGRPSVFCPSRSLPFGRGGLSTRWQRLPPPSHPLGYAARGRPGHIGPTCIRRPASAIRSSWPTLTGINVRPGRLRTAIRPMRSPGKRGVSPGRFHCTRPVGSRWPIGRCAVGSVSTTASPATLVFPHVRIINTLR